MSKGSVRDVSKLVDDWLEYAYDDFEVANLCYAHGHYAYVAVCCQQCIEKALKGLIEQNNGAPLPIHNLQELAKAANVLQLLNRNQRDFLKRLTMYYTVARYPSVKANASRSITKEAANQMIHSAREVLLYLCRTIRKL